MAKQQSMERTAVTAQLASDSLRCSICLETFKEPKVLPCCHTFCKECLSKLPMNGKKPKSPVAEVADTMSSMTMREDGISPELEDFTEPLCSRHGLNVDRTEQIQENVSAISCTNVMPQSVIHEMPDDFMDPPVANEPVLETICLSDPYDHDVHACAGQSTDVAWHNIPELVHYPVESCIRSTTHYASRESTIIDEQEECCATSGPADYLVSMPVVSASNISYESDCREAEHEVQSTNVEVCTNTEITMESGIVEDTMETCVALPYSEQPFLCVDQSEEDSQSYRDSYITCPQCRSEHIIVGSNGVDGFLTDFVIEARLKEQNKSSTKLTCDECETTDSVVSFCDDCSEYLCDFCTTAHKRLKRFVGHKIMKTWEVKVKESVPRKSTPLLCPKHPGEAVQLFCQQCDTVVCNECIVSNHSTHKLSKINSKTRESINEQLLALSAKIDKELTLQEQNLKYVTKVEKVTSDMATEIQRKIDNDFDAYIAALEARRKKLLADSEDKCTAKLKVLWSERDCLERVIADMTATRNFTKRIRECKDDGEFLLMSSQVLPRLKKLESWKWNDTTVENSELYSVDYQESNVNVNLISRAGTIREDQLPRYKIDLGEFSNDAKLGKRQSFSINVSRGKGCRPLTHIKMPSVNIRHIQSQTCDVAEVHVESPPRMVSDSGAQWQETEGYTWRVTYTLYCGGQHKLTIEVNGMVTEREIHVSGRPTVGSLVMRGPNGGYGAVEGSVQGYSSSSDICKITVSVPHARVRYADQYYYAPTNNETFSWGRKGRYEIQLKH